MYLALVVDATMDASHLRTGLLEATRNGKATRAMYNVRRGSVVAAMAEPRLQTTEGAKTPKVNIRTLFLGVYRGLLFSLLAVISCCVNYCS